MERECWQHVEHILQGAEFLMDAAKRRRVRPIPKSGIHAPPVVILGITCVQDSSQTMFPRTWDRHNAAHHHGLLLLWRKQSVPREACDRKAWGALLKWCARWMCDETGMAQLFKGLCEDSNHNVEPTCSPLPAD